MFKLGPAEPVVGSAHILTECSADELFRYIGKELFRNYPKWSPEIKALEQITPGPVGLGTEGRQVRIDLGHRTESRFIISAFEPDTRLTIVGVTDPFRCSYELQNIESGKSTRLIFSFELLELFVIMRPFEELIRVAIRDGAERTVQNIKHLIEADKARNLSSS
ncbi:SRPBCC family protein [Nitrosomonas sp. ANs5]|uniref:SRPBCC family protein n=1 Tax=Nitrosomonas sp. ANs5 TaxID=3423941 RepID=UPI003D351A7F